MSTPPTLSPTDPAFLSLQKLHPSLLPSSISFPLPAALSHIHLGLLSHTYDAPSQITVFNHPEISQWLLPPGFIAEEKHMERYNVIREKVAEQVLQQARTSEESWWGDCPFHVLRVKNEEGNAWKVIGEVDLVKSDFGFLSREERKIAHEENGARSAGDPDIIWEVGFFLHPDYQHQNIIHTALSLLLEIYVPKLNIHIMRAGCEVTNVASRKVMEKVGFRCLGAKAEGEGGKESWEMEWKREWAVNGNETFASRIPQLNACNLHG